ncbi:MAG: CBS domain-containing protein [Silvanigrellaceae bacterium]|nr:CBS domain-containing protein [Silvanigrellaceae bacterium]
MQQLNLDVSIEPFIHKKVIELQDDASISTAARAMAEQNIGCVLVSNKNNSLVGIVTDRDLSTKALAFEKPFSTPLSEVMVSSLIVIDEFAKLDEVVKLMRIHSIRRVPVVRRTSPQESKHCIGMITLDDLIASGLINAKSTAAIVRSQISQ